MASFRKRKQGWEYRISVKLYNEDGTWKYGQKSGSGFKTKKEAEIAAARHHERILSGEVAHSQTIKEFLEDWYKNYAAVKTSGLSDNTLVNYRYAIERAVKVMGYYQVSYVSPAIYQRCINKLLETYSKKTVDKTHHVLKSAYRQAFINGEIAKDPTLHVKIKDGRKQNKLKYLLPALVPKLLEHIYMTNFDSGVYFELLFETGMRKGEALAIEMSDIDWTNRTIRVDQSYDPINKRMSETKTDSSIRTIPVREKFMDKLRSYVKQKMHKREILGAYYQTHINHNYVFTTDDGRIMSHDTLRNHFKAALKAVEHVDLPIHSTRHTHAVMMLEAGASMKEVQERLGHSTMTTTADTYSHVTNKMQTRAVELFDQYMKLAEKEG